ncbi:Probable LRR receptor-like serine/threonine-protein kinase At3g47570 [Linum grandiflorum]
MSLTSLSIALDLSYNQFRGALPTEVGNLKNLGILDLSHNMLSGNIPSSLGSCISLESLYLQGNNLQGVIPSSLSSLRGNDFMALNYDFLANGSLEDWLHRPIERVDESRTRSLNFIQRLNVAIDIASAVDYLHNNCGTPIVHCDLKPSNVLLDEDMVAHVGDFGLA